MSKFVKKLSQYLPQHSNAFGLKIFADSSVPKHKLEHTANVLYQYLDNDEDGKVDNAKVLKALVKRNGGMIINDTPQSEEIIEPKYRRITEKYDFNYSRLYTNEIRPEGSGFRQGSDEFDATLEEVLHMVTKQGYGFAYPSVFGLEGYSLPEGDETSQLSEAVRLSRGGIDDNARSNYPKEAWYRRYDTDCPWECIATEYIYWGITSFLGGQNYTCLDLDKVCDDQPDRGTAIFDEWELNTAKKIKKRDVTLYRLLTKKKYSLPAMLPDGNYSARSSQFESDFQAIFMPSYFHEKSADKITNFNPSTEALEIDADSFGIDSSATFATGKNKKVVMKNLAKQDVDFLYDQKKGGLYYNENSVENGFGDGGIIAILKGAPDLTASNLEFI